MIKWENGDYNLDKICSGMNEHLIKFDTKNYFIYGLQKLSRPHVRITPSCPALLKKLFKKSGYTLEERKELDLDSIDLTGMIAIGVRKDIRQNVKIAKQLVKTIVFAMENKLIVDNSTYLDLGVDKGV